MQVNENFFSILWPIPFFFHCSAFYAGILKSVLRKVRNLRILTFLTFLISFFCMTNLTKLTKSCFRFVNFANFANAFFYIVNCSG